MVSYPTQLKRYDINILDKEIIPDILKHFDIEASLYSLTESSYNPFGYNYFNLKLKDPPPGLLGVYFKPRINPFNEKYPFEEENYKYTLEDLLRYEIAIEEAFVFWDFKQKLDDNKTKIHLIVSDIYVDESKEECINNYLLKTISSKNQN